MISATAITVGVCEGGRWRTGVHVAPRFAAPEFLRGVILAAILIGAADGLIELASGVRHARGNGFPWLELVAVFIPAALHEELAFRGYVFQKLRTWRREAGYAFSAIVFALLHANNDGLTIIAVVNIILAGVLLAQAYERYERLWFPIGIHLAWNVFSGPILGYPVSGFVPATSVLTVTLSGPRWITGGLFGIEGSVWIAVVEIAAIIGLGYHPPRTPAKEQSSP